MLAQFIDIIYEFMEYIYANFSLKCALDVYCKYLFIENAHYICYLT